MYVKKKFTTILKIVAVCLVVICGVYCYLCGGISNAVDNVKNGNYFAFQQKEQTDDEVGRIEVGIKLTNKYPNINQEDEVLYAIMDINKKQYNYMMQFNGKIVEEDSEDAIEINKLNVDASNIVAEKEYNKCKNKLHFTFRYIKDTDDKVKLKQ